LIAHIVWAQAPAQQTFPSAQAAADALVSALQKNDEQALTKVLGPDAKTVLSCGDESQDIADRQQVAQKYQEMHRLVTEPDGTTTLYIGAENWPFPYPLVQRNNSWYFDSDAAKSELLYRNVGEDELTVIQVLHELSDAEKDYYQHAHDGQAGGQYSQKIDSDPGKQDGLHWNSSADNAQSPIGPALAAAASPEDSKEATSSGEPFEGYYFRILLKQGPSAPGGAKSYVNDGKMTGGFAILAYPAEYGSTGVMTFIVDDDGTVHQKDLGPNTGETEKSMTQFDADSSWQKAE
jgi:hypothetical protein